MFLGKPSVRILLCRKDLPLAWLSSLQVPPMQPRRQQLPASQPRDGDSAWPDSTACRPAGTPRWPPCGGDEMMEPEASFRLQHMARWCRGGTSLPSGMKRPGLWVAVKLYVWCLQLFLTWLPHTVTILSKLIGSKKKKKYVPNYHLQTFLTRIFFPCWGQSVNLNCDKSSRGSKYTTAA